MVSSETIIFLLQLNCSLTRHQSSTLGLFEGLQVELFGSTPHESVKYSAGVKATIRRTHSCRMTLTFKGRAGFDDMLKSQCHLMPWHGNYSWLQVARQSNLKMDEVLSKCDTCSQSPSDDTSSFCTANLCKQSLNHLFDPGPELQIQMSMSVWQKYCYSGHALNVII